ncbi:MAG: hypothetical protein AAF491_03645, partial [Verrucomicrobiota bacterium]
SIYEGGVLVPLLARWPKVIGSGKTSDAIVGLSDFMATFADLTGEELGEQEGPDSISFAPVLRDPAAKTDRNDLVLNCGTAFAIREGDWKLCLTPSSGVKYDSENAAGNDPMPIPAWRAAIDRFGGKPSEEDLLKAPFVQLFDLSKDPHEDVNLAEQHPERVRHLVELLEGQIENGRSTPGPKLENDKQVKIVNLRDKRLPDFVTD